jgi:hypothetical protein
MNDETELCKTLVNLSEKISLIESMRENCYEEAFNYNINKVLNPLIIDLEE